MPCPIDVLKVFDDVLRHFQIAEVIRAKDLRSRSKQKVVAISSSAGRLIYRRRRCSLPSKHRALAIELFYTLSAQYRTIAADIPLLER